MIMAAPRRRGMFSVLKNCSSNDYHHTRSFNINCYNENWLYTSYDCCLLMRLITPLQWILMLPRYVVPIWSHVTTFWITVPMLTYTEYDWCRLLGNLRQLSIICMCQYSSSDIVQLLLQYMGLIHIYQMTTILHRYSHYQVGQTVTKWILECGADVNFQRKKDN